MTTRRVGGRIEIEVADTGPGIPEDDLTKVLEPLFSTKAAGTGLGLPIVRRIMESHCGGFEIVSTRRSGTRARLWLPLDPGSLTPQSGNSRLKGTASPGPAASSSRAAR